MPEQKPKPELLPCPKNWCPGIGEAGWQLSPKHHTVKCSVCRCRTPYFTTKEESIALWNKRPPSELERLARAFFDKVTEIGPLIDGIIGVQTARGYPYTGPNWKAEYDALAAFLAEPQKGKQE